MGGKTLHSQTRTLALKVLKFFEDEKSNKKFLIPVDQALKRACAATGISKATLLRIKNEAKNVSPIPQEQSDNDTVVLSIQPSTSEAKPDSKLSTPGKKRKQNSRKSELDILKQNRTVTDNKHIKNEAKNVSPIPQEQSDNDTVVLSIQPSTSEAKPDSKLSTPGKKRKQNSRKSELDILKQNRTVTDNKHIKNEAKNVSPIPQEQSDNDTVVVSIQPSTSEAKPDSTTPGKKRKQNSRKIELDSLKQNRTVTD